TLARPDRRSAALRLLFDSSLACVLGDLYPPAPANGVARGVAARSRVADPGIDRAARGWAAAGLHAFRHTPRLPRRSVRLFREQPDGRRPPAHRVRHRLAARLHRAAPLVARGVRALVERRGGTIRVIYPDGRSVRIPKGLSVLDASRRAGIPHASLCGGRARCSTCRVRVLLGLDRLPAQAPVEARVLARLGADRAVRLACQLKPTADVSVWPLLPPETTMADRSVLNLSDSGTERFVAILFVDIRRSTELVENRSEERRVG